MSVQIPPNMSLKTVASVADVARLVGLSRARFYQLQKAGVFPPPVYDIRTRRPVYTEEQQRACLEVRQRNCGVNGQPVLFYCRRPVVAAPAPRRSPTPPRPQHTPPPQRRDYAEVTAAIRSLGLQVTDSQVAAAVTAVYPHGLGGRDEAEVVRAIFLYLRRQNSADNVRR